MVRSTRRTVMRVGIDELPAGERDEVDDGDASGTSADVAAADVPTSRVSRRSGHAPVHSNRAVSYLGSDRMDDFYDLLDVPENASTDDVKRAWREKAREYHPDVNDDARASAQFKTLRRAYEVLSDETERAAYDRMGHANYVSKRLDGLPTAGMTRPSSRSAGNRWKTASRADGSSAGDGRSDASARTSSTRDRGRSSSASRSSSSSSDGSSRSRRSSASRSSSATRSSAASRSSSSDRSSRSSRRRRSRRSAAGTDSNGPSASGSTGSASTASESAGSESTRSPLWYAWTAVLLAGVGYAVGLAAYARANLDALSSVAASLSADPAAALATGHGLTPPGTFALGVASGSPSLALAFPLGAALLALVFAGTVAKFGHGTAYLYLAGALAPLGSLAIGPLVAVEPAGATLLLLVVLPLAATLLFLADVGRFLFAGL
jgi:curved DNA-binding protein CbpA